MTEFVAVTPVGNWNLGEREILPGLLVKQFDEDSRPDLENWSHFLSGHEIGALVSHAMWMCCEFAKDGVEVPLRWDDPAIEAAIDTIELGLYAIRVSAPIGIPGPILVCRRGADGRLSIEQGMHPLPGKPASWAAFCGVPEAFLSEVVKLSAQIRSAFQQNVIRIQTALHLLEHGLQATNPHLAVLLFTAGLDGLTMATGSRQFVERLYAILGKDTLIFPADRLQRQPKYTVGKVAADLYELRSQVAHGKNIGKKFRERCGFEFLEDEFVTQAHREYMYRDTLEECAVFLLCSALRKVLLTQDVEVVANDKSWRKLLEDGL